MSPVLIVSLLDPVFWAIGFGAVVCGYRLPEWSWIRALRAIICFPGLIGVIALGETPGTDRMFPEEGFG